MKKIIVTTPENIDIEYTLADIGSRIAAALIDTIIQLIVSILMFLGLLLVHTYSRQFWNKYIGWIIGISLLILALISYGYFIFMELKMNGMTLGKKVMHLRTIRINGQPITLKHSAIRNLFRVFVDTYGIGVIMIFFSKNRKRLGDLAASTMVIIEKNSTIPISLESLEGNNKNFNYYLTLEEQSLLQNYYERRGTMEDSSELQSELKSHFRNKFESLGISKEWESFINEL